MKEEKKGKPTKVTKWVKDGKPAMDKYQNFIFFVEFGDEKGTYLTKDENQKIFEVGKEVTYLKEVFSKEGKDDFIKFTIPKPEFKKGFVNTQLTIEDFILREKIKAVEFSMSYANAKVIAGITKDEDQEKEAKRLLTWQGTMMDKILKSNKKSE